VEAGNGVGEVYQVPGRQGLAAGRRPARRGPFLCFLYTPPAKLYPVFIRAFLSCEARIAKEKNVDALYLAVFAAIVAAVAALLQFCASLPQGDRA